MTCANQRQLLKLNEHISDVTTLFLSVLLMFISYNSGKPLILLYEFYTYIYITDDEVVPVCTSSLAFSMLKL